MLDKLLTGGPVADVDLHWQLIQHAIVRVAEASKPGVRLEGGKLQELVNTTLANV